MKNGCQKLTVSHLNFTPKQTLHEVLSVIIQRSVLHPNHLKLNARKEAVALITQRQKYCKSYTGEGARTAEASQTCLAQWTVDETLF